MTICDNDCSIKFCSDECSELDTHECYDSLPRNKKMIKY